MVILIESRIPVGMVPPAVGGSSHMIPDSVELTVSIYHYTDGQRHTRLSFCCCFLSTNYAPGTVCAGRETVSGFEGFAMSG